MAERVCAVVVTYNRKALLRECLKALKAQTRPLDGILVVNNASTDGTREVLKEEFPEVEVLDLPENIGGAGGFHEGLKWAYEKGYGWFWLMDDDAKAQPDCLEHLLTRKGDGEVLIPVQVDSLGRKYGAGRWRCRYVPLPPEEYLSLTRVEMFAFVGTLIHRKVVDRVGLPHRDFFICADDWEYALRMRRAGIRPLLVPDAVMHHEYGGKTRVVRRLGRASSRPMRAPWKFYYGARNTLLMLRILSPYERVASFLLFFLLSLRWTLGDLVYEPKWAQRTYYRWLGFWHGLLGLSGKRVSPDG